MSGSPKVFTVRRCYSNGVFTIRVDEKPAVIAFRNKWQAKRFAAMETSMTAPPSDGKKKKVQPICVDHVNVQSLHRRCSMNSLALVVYDENGEYTMYAALEKSIDDLQFHFENVLKYMSD